MAFKFENLRVFHYALEVNNHICTLAKKFPKDELFVLTSQMKRASGSVVLNITEGSTMQTHNEFKRFLRMANRSALEVAGCLYLARIRTYVNEEEFQLLYEKVEKLIAMIQALI